MTTPRPPDLSRDQLECLRLAAAGYAYHQMAARLHVSASTVRCRLRDARTALGARTTTHAVGIAMHHGIVTAEHLELP